MAGCTPAGTAVRHGPRIDGAVVSSCDRLQGRRGLTQTTSCSPAAEISGWLALASLIGQTVRLIRLVSVSRHQVWGHLSLGRARGEHADGVDVRKLDIEWGLVREEADSTALVKRRTGRASGE